MRSLKIGAAPGAVFGRYEEEEEDEDEEGEDEPGLLHEGGVLWDTAAD